MVENTAYGIQTLIEKQAIAFMIYLCRLSTIASIPTNYMKRILNLLDIEENLINYYDLIYDYFIAVPNNDKIEMTPVSDILFLFRNNYNKYENIILEGSNSYITAIFRDFESETKRYKDNQLSLSDYKKNLNSLVCITIADLSRKNNKTPSLPLIKQNTTTDCYERHKQQSNLIQRRPNKISVSKNRSKSKKTINFLGGHPSKWDADTIKELESLWLSGMSANDISKVLHISKNAIIGKVHRLKLPLRPSPIIREQGEFVMSDNSNAQYTIKLEQIEISSSDIENELYDKNSDNIDSVPNEISHGIAGSEQSYITYNKNNSNSQTLNKGEIIDKFISKYKQIGCIQEDELFNAITENGISIFETNSIMEELLSHGVIIQSNDEQALSEPDDSEKNENQESIYTEVLALAPGLNSIVNYIKKITPLKRGERTELLRQAQNGNPWAYKRLFDNYLRSVINKALIAYKKYDTPLEDAFQEGAIGLMKAIERFDVTESQAFSTYSSYAISGYIDRSKDFAPNRIIHYPPHVHDLLNKIYVIVTEHDCPECSEKDELDCPVLLAAIIEKLECSEHTAQKLLGFFAQVRSLDEMVEEIAVSSEDQSNVAHNNDFSETLLKCLSTLTPREEYVLKARAGLLDNQAKEATLEEIGRSLGVTRERIRQIEAKALRKLKHPSRSKKLRNYLDYSPSDT